MDQQEAEPAEPSEPVYFFLKKRNVLSVKFAFGHKEE